MILNPYRFAAVGGGGDPDFASVVSLLHFDGADASTTFTDQKGKVWTPFGNAQIDTAQSKFGGASGLFDGAGDYLTTPSSTDFDFGSGNFTVEMWIRTAQTAAYPTLLCREWGGSPYSGGWSIFLNGAGGGPMEIYCADFSTGGPLLTSSSSAYRDSLQHHIAWVRNGNVHTLYIDGTSVAAATTAFSFASVAKNLTIGNDLTFGPRFYNGHIDDLRITKGVARYTANFTPPTAAFPDS